MEEFYNKTISEFCKWKLVFDFLEFLLKLGFFERKSNQKKIFQSDILTSNKPLRVQDI